MESPPRHPALVRLFGEQAWNPTMCPALGCTNILQTAPGKSPTRAVSSRGKCNMQAEVVFSNIGINQTNCSPTRARHALGPRRIAVTRWMC